MPKTLESKKKYYDGGSSKKSGGSSVFPSENKVKNVGNLPQSNFGYGDDTMNWIDNQAKKDNKVKNSKK